MERLKKILDKIIFPGPAVTAVSIPLSAALLFYTFVIAGKSGLIAYVSYAFSAYTLVIVCTWIVRIPKDPLRRLLRRNKFIHRYLTDVLFKAHVSLYLSFDINLVFVALKLFYGIRFRSVWYITLAVYYIMLAVMRLLLLGHIRRVPIGKELMLELRRYRVCGAILLLMNIALLGVVVLVVQNREGFYYEGNLIYVVALYAFYNIITSPRNVILYKKYSSPVVSASKGIKLATALVSILSLETAMIARFGEEKEEAFRQWMSGATGGCVCLIVLAMSVYMIIHATVQLRKLRGTGEEALP